MVLPFPNMPFYSVPFLALFLSILHNCCVIDLEVCSYVQNEPLIPILLVDLTFEPFLVPRSRCDV